MAAAAARGKTRGALGEHRHPAGAESVAQPHVAATDRRMQGPDPSHRTARVRASHEQTTRELVVPADDRQRQRTGAVRTRCVHVRTGRNQRRRGLDVTMLQGSMDRRPPLEPLEFLRSLFSIIFELTEIIDTLSP